MRKTFCNLPRILLCLVLILLMANTAVCRPAAADGGPVVGHELWDSLVEGQQIAVISARDEDTARVDLFVSLLDKTGESHEVVFFLPLGVEAEDFYVVEQDIDDFDDAKTGNLDSIIQRSATDKHVALLTLFMGSVLANGFVLAPVWAPLLLTGCGESVGPLAEYHTDSSEVGIYEITADTDIRELINTTGLPDDVADTLERFQGQQIAIVRLQTSPQGAGSSGTYYWEAPERGLHLSWTTYLTKTASGSTFSYALGTGSAWSNPIEMTRVYVSASPGLDFSIEYPRLGSNQSGFQSIFGEPRIVDYYQLSAYAVDEARGDFGHVWRATYTQSNSSEDIVITFKPQSFWGKVRSAVEDDPIRWSFIFAIVVGLILWLLAWFFLMPRFTGRRPEQEPRLRLYWGLVYPVINAALLVFPGLLLLLFIAFGLVLPALFFLFLVFGGISLLAFWLFHARRLGIPVSKAFWAFIGTSAAANGVYLILALVFGACIGLF